MEKKELNIYQITVGKYKGKDLSEMLRDRKYCEWIVEQSWFKESYEFLYNKIKEYDPKIYFLPKEKEIPYLLNMNKYFNLNKNLEIELSLNDDEKRCYEFYLKTLEEIKNKIEVRKTKKDENIYDITAPSKWLQKFEKDYELPRDTFKEFLYAYELPNITKVIEEIKSYGGLEYKGNQSFKIAKKRSSEQELYWEEILKEKFGDELGTQFKYENCIFDFLHIPTNRIYECKLNLKDFDEKQYEKYQLTLDKYNIVFLIGKDCVIDIDLETIYTTNIKEYLLYQCNIPLLKNPSKFDEMIFDFDIYEIENFKEVL